MRTLIAIVLSLSFMGCTPVVKSSSPNHVTVESYQMDLGKAQRVADRECAKYRRRAELTLKASTGGESTDRDERDYIFACVE